MKFKLWSDLHIETRHFYYEEQPEDKDLTLILAGDIGTRKSGLEPFLIEMCSYFQQVIYVFGNHEFYNDVIEEFQHEIYELARSLQNLAVLDNTGYIVPDEGIRILGSTLWTELTPRNQEIVMCFDYKAIKMYDSVSHIPMVMTPRDQNYLYQKAVLWLRHKLDEPYGGKTVVLTHWSPTHKLSDPKFFGNPNNPYFCNDMEHLMHTYKIDTWLYGHTHGKVFIDYDEDKRFNGTRLINNPRGYHHEDEESDFEMNRIFEVE